MSDRIDDLDDRSRTVGADDFETLFEYAPCGYLATTPDGTIVRVNQTFCDRTGFRAEDLIGSRRFVDLLTGGGRIYHETHFAPMLQMAGEVREIALEIVAADGSRHPVLVNAAVSHGADGQVRAIRTAVFDAPDRRGYEQELLDAKRRAEASEAHAQLLASTLQQTLIPPAPPDIPGLDVAAAYRPAGDGHEIGGDFYDIFEVAEKDWVVVVGDVRGKGVGAAVVTAVIRHTIRAAAVRNSSPADMLAVVNTVLLHDDGDRFCTLAIVRLHRDGDAWTATVGLAGHPCPILRPQTTRPVAFGEAGTVAGVLAEPAFSDAAVVLAPGDSLVLYTDGVTEARRGPEFFGDGRLYACVAARAASATDRTDNVLAAAMKFQADQPRDDIVVVSIVVPDGPVRPDAADPAPLLSR